MAVDGEAAPVAEKIVEVYGGTEEEERKKRAEEGVTLRGLVDEGVRADTGANASGLYELCGESFLCCRNSEVAWVVGRELRSGTFRVLFVSTAIVTHKGASADSGHYVRSFSFFSTHLSPSSDLLIFSSLSQIGWGSFFLLTFPLRSTRLARSPTDFF